MNSDRILPLRKVERAALSVWENEGGAPAANTDGSLFGRRREPDRSWTVYHVFTGIPAVIEGRNMTGLNRASATNGMLSLNLHYVAHNKGQLLIPSDPAFIPLKEH
jgi:hypothetical protein